MAEYFNNNSFVLGALLFGCLYLSTLLYSIVCLVWKIRITEFLIFPAFKYSLYSKTVGGTKFVLGWFPTSAAIKPFDNTLYKEEELTYRAQDIPYALFNKPGYVKALFRLVPVITFLLAFCIAVFILNPSHPVEEVRQIFNYVTAAFKTMFSDEEARKFFILRTREQITGINVVAFSFAIMTGVMIPFQVLRLFYRDNDNKSKLQTVIEFIFMLAICWLFCWKVPKFIFSYFTLSQSLSYILSLFSGFVLTGVLLFFITLGVVKAASRN